jgi:hypothetical protein
MLKSTKAKRTCIPYEQRYEGLIPGSKVLDLNSDSPDPMETLLAHRTNCFPALEPLENPPAAGVGKRAAWPSTAGTTAGVPRASVWIRRRRRSCDAKLSRLPVRLWPIFRPCDGPGSSPCARRVHPLCRVLRAPNAREAELQRCGRPVRSDGINLSVGAECKL